MSCTLAVAAVLLMSDPNVALAAAQPTVSAAAALSVADEPLFADIIRRAQGLKVVTADWEASGATQADGFFASAAWTRFHTQATELAALNMQGHIILRDRGTDSDLRCILRGVSEDMTARVEAFRAAPSAAERAVALSELTHLFDDNAAVILAPPHQDD